VYEYNCIFEARRTKIAFACRETSSHLMVEATGAGVI